MSRDLPDWAQRLWVWHVPYTGIEWETIKVNTDTIEDEHSMMAQLVGEWIERGRR